MARVPLGRIGALGDVVGQLDSDLVNRAARVK